MTVVNWRVIVEASSALAILGGLVFVGLQMRQDQAISTAELQQELIAARLSLSELAISNAELLDKANSGDALSSSEMFKLDSLIMSYWGWAFFGQRRWESINHPAADAPVRAFAIFLDENPGALTAWRQRQERNSSTREILGTQSFIEDEFDRQVDVYLSILEE